MKPVATKGARLLGDQVRRHGAAEVGRRLGASEAAVRAWVKGQRVPSGAARAAMASAVAIPAEAWVGARGGSPATDHAPSPPPPKGGRATSRTTPKATAPTRGASRPTKPAPPAPAVEVDAKAACLDTVTRLRAELDRLDGDPAATPRERASVATALTSSTRLLARLSGSLELSASQILRSPTWRALVSVLTGALRPVPGALDAAAKALRDFEGRSGP